MNTLFKWPIASRLFLATSLLILLIVSTFALVASAAGGVDIGSTSGPKTIGQLSDGAKRLADDDTEVGQTVSNQVQASSQKLFEPFVDNETTMHELIDVDEMAKAAGEHNMVELLLTGDYDEYSNKPGQQEDSDTGDDDHGAGANGTSGQDAEQEAQLAKRRQLRAEMDELRRRASKELEEYMQEPRTETQDAIRSMENIANYCNYFKSSISVRSIADLYNLKEGLDEYEAKLATCMHSYLVQVMDMTSVVYPFEQLCTIKKATKIRDHMLKFAKFVFNPYDDMPSAARRFFLAYGLKVSDLCRKRNLNQLLQVQLNTKDLATFLLWTDERSFLSRLLPEPDDFKDLVVPPTLTQFIKFKLKNSDDFVYMKAPSGGRIIEMQMMCEKRFKPIYGPLLTPLILMASVKFNYTSKPTKRSYQENRRVWQWYRVLYLCETLDQVRVIETDPVDGSNLTEEQRKFEVEKSVKMLSKKEGKRLWAAQKQSLEAKWVHLQQMDYKFVEDKLPNFAYNEQIYDKKDKSLRRAVLWALPFTLQSAADLVPVKPLQVVGKAYFSLFRKPPVFLTSLTLGALPTTNEANLNRQMFIKYLNEFNANTELGKFDRGKLASVKWWFRRHLVILVRILISIIYITTSMTLTHVHG